MRAFDVLALEVLHSTLPHVLFTRTQLCLTAREEGKLRASISLERRGQVF